MFRQTSTKETNNEILTNSTALQIQKGNRPQKKFKFGERPANRDRFRQPLIVSQNIQSTSATFPSSTTSESSADELNVAKEVWKPTIRYFTGAPEQIIEWFTTIIEKEKYFYEVIAQIKSIHHMDTKKIIALRGTYGPVLKVLIYDNDRIEILPEVGAIVRCVGVKFNEDTLRCFKIRAASEAELLMLPRRSNMCKLYC